MPTFPVRGLGSTGIVTDAFPSDVENVGTFTGGVNIRFKNGRASRGPICRTVAELPHDPGHVFAIPPSTSGYDEVVTIAQDFGSIYRLNGAAFDDLTPTGHQAAAGDYAITSCALGGVAYINRETHLALYKTPGAEKFSTIPGWSRDDRCKVLRAYKDQLVALGVTKAGVYYPTMVKWSDFSYYGAPPQSWDPTSTTNSAGENIVNEMQQRIVDGLSLRDSFVLYCTASVWLMDYVGGNDIYTFRKLFDEVGVINPNCVVQVGGLHYVFDRNDIYVHDGVSPKSIADARVKQFVFDALDFSRVGLCFVQHDAKLTEVRFTYPAGDQYVGFQNPTTGCNRQAVYNYSNDTWTFYDVPNVVGCTKAALLSGASWDTDPDMTFEGAGGLWISADGDEDRHCLLVGRADPSVGLNVPKLFGFELLTGGRMTQPVADETVRPAQIERIGIDLDAQGKNLTQYMHLQAIWPQMSAERPDECFWQFGATDIGNIEPVWSLPATFDHRSETRIDVNEAGKYLGYRFQCGGTSDFQLSGFDVQLITRGRR
jgi:hypothetical protein